MKKIIRILTTLSFVIFMEMEVWQTNPAIIVTLALLLLGMFTNYKPLVMIMSVVVLGHSIVHKHIETFIYSIVIMRTWK